MNKNILSAGTSIKTALQSLNELGENLTLFIVEESQKLVGTLTDGDIRRGLLNGISIIDPVENVMNRNYKFIRKKDSDNIDLRFFREQSLLLIPIIDDDGTLIKILDLNRLKGFIGVDAVIMAGGEGMRLRPLTLETPKPLLKVGDKAIIEHNIERLHSFGIDRFIISVKYLGEKIMEALGDGSSKNTFITYLDEDSPMGTIGCLTNVSEFWHDDILVMNSDLLTNINFEDFYRLFKSSDADMAVASTPYNITVPYAVLQLDKERVTSLEEKPTYTYYSNAGIYLLKKECVDFIPKGKQFNATDLIEELIGLGRKVINYPIVGYWLDIGNHADFAKAQEDIRHISL